MVVPSGFLVPTKGDGALTIYDLRLAAKVPYQITKTREQWFYHRVVWLDMDNDGKLDAVTCRAQKPLFGMLIESARSAGLSNESYATAEQ